MADAWTWEGEVDGRTVRVTVGPSGVFVDVVATGYELWGESRPAVLEAALRAAVARMRG